MKDVKGRIRLFLKKYFKGHEIDENDDIFSLGFVNSLFAMQLVMFLEKEFSITIENEDLDLDHFRTISQMEQLVLKKSV